MSRTTKDLQIQKERTISLTSKNNINAAHVDRKQCWERRGRERRKEKE